MTIAASASYNHSGPSQSATPESSMHTRPCRPLTICVSRYFSLALAGLLILFSSNASASAQQQPPPAQDQRAPVAPPGDTLTTPGPLAQNLSPRLDRRDLAKAIKRVADWQLRRIPAAPQVVWTWAALYTGFMAVPEKVAGDKYKQAM